MRSFRTCCMMMLALMMILFACVPADAGCGLFSGMRARRAARQQATSYQSYSYQSYGYAAPVQGYYGVQQAAVCSPCGQPAMYGQQAAAPCGQPASAYYSTAPAAAPCAPCGQSAAPPPLGTTYYNPRVIYSTPMQAQMDCSTGTCKLRR